MNTSKEVVDLALKRKMAKAMKTSRSQLDRILDPNNDNVQLSTLMNAARVLNRELSIDLV